MPPVLTSIDAAPPPLRRPQLRVVSPVLRLVAMGVGTAVVILGIAFVALIRDHGGGESKLAIAQRTVDTYARSGYLTWRATHPTSPCPQLGELAAISARDDGIDPWGNPYRIACASGAHHHVWVWSLGEDALPGTGDDVWSDR